ncbi:hypothetical protein QAO71_17045 (plasmid) [Halopseudomonas sp. SMJS2]|uniref:hypothetical protein n=1 Tax=Halopseudomonas sp. SMJS2 TaxID=3041098 RepID=UPI002453694D|nr:hypothetical protein [Halopseudomonas sp. SMJS2]WGK63477.1 hypothetical protein QAO71_17045 [Halopseudomonas sp. SMJS2]
MSTKIRNGLILRNATLDTAYAAVDSIRRHCVYLAQHDVAMTLNSARMLDEDIAVNMCDLDSDGPLTTPKLMRSLYDAREQVLGRGLRSPGWDFTFEVVLIPSAPDVLAIFYLENNSGFSKALESVGFEDYHYQSSTDRPDQIDEAEWSHREAIWKSALKGQPPSEIGLVAKIVTWDHLELTHFNAELMASCVPSEHQRRINVATYLCELELGHEQFTCAKGVYQIVENINAAATDRARTVLLANETGGPGQSLTDDRKTA